MLGSSSPGHALAAATSLQPEALRLLRRWVEVNSYTGAVDNVNRMGQELRDAFALPELTLTVQRGNGFGDHMSWSTPAWDEAPGGRLLLVGHHDTVFPPGSFEGWTESDNIARGPGVLDMKGGIATVWCALSALSKVGMLAQLPLAFVSVADEEVGSPDSRPFTARWATGARAALVFEAGRATDAIITRRKGTGSMTVTAFGRAAHAGNAHADGINAIWALCRWVDRAQALTDYDRGVTLNVGTIAGGTSKNTVPERAELTLDFRFVFAEDGPRIVSALEDTARELEADTRARFELSGGVRRPPLERTDASAALYRAYAEHARAEGLGGEESPLIGGGSDANDIASLGVPVIDALGPRGRGFHTHDEHIELDTLPRRTGALVRLLCSPWS